MATTIESIKAEVRCQLVGLGWTGMDSTAFASKEYQTAVGPKVGLFYLFGCGSEEYWRLSGDYQSEGSNILSAHSVLIPQGASPEERAALVREFAANVDAIVAESYAARLYRLGVRPRNQHSHV